jgi:hypothetical protein
MPTLEPTRSKFAIEDAVHFIDWIPGPEVFATLIGANREHDESPKVKSLVTDAEMMLGRLLDDAAWMLDDLGLTHDEPCALTQTSSDPLLSAMGMNLRELVDALNECQMAWNGIRGEKGEPNPTVVEYVNLYRELKHLRRYLA